MDPSLKDSYAQLTKDIEDYIKANDLDIIQTRIKTILDEILAKLSFKIKKNVEQVQEMKKFMDQSYQSLLIQNQPWKISMFKNLEDEMRKKIGTNFQVTPKRIKNIILEEFAQQDQKQEDKLEWFQKLYELKRQEISQGHQLLLEARKAEYQSNFQKAYQFYTKAKEKESILASHALGAYYQNGIHVQKNMNQAINMYKDAASRYSTSALNALGRILENGLGVEASKAKAIFYFKLAAEMGQGRAWANLHSFYKGRDATKSQLYKQTAKDSVTLQFN